MDNALPAWLLRSEAFVEDLCDEIGNGQSGTLRAAPAAARPGTPQPAGPTRSWLLPALASAVAVCGPLWAVAAGL